jgi:hypothetical protein
VQGTLNPDGSFSAHGIGHAAGYDGIYASFDGTYLDGQLQGEYQIGVEGGLPGGDYIAYSIDTMPVDDEWWADQLVQQSIQEFFDQLNSAQFAGNVDAMVDMLHPAVTNNFELDACTRWMAEINDPDVEIVVDEVVDFGPWTFTAGSVSVELDDIFTLNVRIHDDGETTPSQTHLGMLGEGSYGWFTNCAGGQ